jgi:predicted Fe-Mo cluster-binding NifX family protein
MKKTGLSILLLILALLITSSVYADDKGKIAVATEGKTTAADVSAVAARTPYFLIFDSANSLLEVSDNPYKDKGRRAGPSVATFLAQKGVTFVVAGRFGDNMIQAMKGKGIEYLEFRGSAEAALDKVSEVRK